MNSGIEIYKKISLEIAKKAEKKPAKTDIFSLLEKIGKQAIKKSSAEFKKQEAPALPDYSQYIYPALRRKIQDIIQREFQISIEIENPPPEIESNFSIPCFKIAGAKKISVSEAAEAVSRAIEKKNIAGVSKIETAGNYVNVFLEQNLLAQNVFDDALRLKDFYGSSNEGKGKIAIIDYSSPNSAKPMSIGHLRSTIIGNALKNIYEFQGWRVFGVNHLGDWGTQFGQLLFAFEKWGSEKEIKKDAISHLFKLYVKFNREAGERPEYRDSAKEIFKKMEQGDVSLVKRWAEFCDLSVKEFLKIYKKLGVEFNLILGESFFHKKTGEIIGDSLEKGLAHQEEDGPIVADLKNPEIPTFLLQKQDETSLYITRDLAAAKFRIETFKPQKILYVAGSEQNLHFRQFFEILKRLSYSADIKLEHINFGLYSLPEGKISTRLGRVVFLKDVLNEALARAGKLSKTKKTTETVGIGAIIFNDLAQDRRQNVVFNWEKILNLKGDSGPYLQYTYVRTGSILRKAGTLPRSYEPIISSKSEAALTKLLAQFPEAVRVAIEEASPDLIAKYLLSLSKSFSQFYEKEPVLKAKSDIRKTRLLLVGAVSQTLQNGLRLLGIRTPKRM